MDDTTTHSGTFFTDISIFFKPSSVNLSSFKDQKNLWGLKKSWFHFVKTFCLNKGEWRNFFILLSSPVFLICECLLSGCVTRQWQSSPLQMWDEWFFCTTMIILYCWWTGQLLGSSTCRKKCSIIFLFFQSSEARAIVRTKGKHPWREENQALYAIFPAFQKRVTTKSYLGPTCWRYLALSYRLYHFYDKAWRRQAFLLFSKSCLVYHKHVGCFLVIEQGKNHSSRNKLLKLGLLLGFVETKDGHQRSIIG